jgi:hypothetical protein
MGQDQTVKPTPPHADLAESQQQFASDDSETRRVSANSLVGAESGIQPNASDDSKSDIPGVSVEAPFSSIAAVLTADYATFINALWRAVEADIAPTGRRAFQLAARPTPNEAAAFDRLVDWTIDQTNPSAAAKICAALAARTTGRSARRATGNFATADGPDLFAAWLETAHAIEAARGSAGLERIPRAAKHLARKSAECGDSAAEIASTLRRIAARIPELSLERRRDSNAAGQERDFTPRMTLSPPGTVSQSPIEAMPYPH